MARALAVVRVSDPLTMEAVKTNKVPKGNVLEAARVAGLFGIKKTSDLIPDCHPLPIEQASVSYELGDDSIEIEVQVKTIYKTGVEVEAMHGASIVALTIYDMLKPIDKGVEIGTIKLIEKKGGKSDYRKGAKKGLQAAVVVCSDMVSAGKKEDKAGKAICTKLETMGVEVKASEVVADEKEQIQSMLDRHSGEVDLVIFTGGTGLSPRDVTPDSVLPMLERRVAGIEEAIRRYGTDRTPFAMLSRSVAGFIGKTMVLTLPGSTRGAEESMDAIFPEVLHVFKVLDINFKH